MIVPYKRELYAAEGVGCYLMSDPDAKTIEQLVLNDRGSCETLNAINEIQINVCKDCELEFRVADVLE